MRVRTALGSALVALAVTASGTSAAAPAKAKKAMMPTFSIISATSNGMCVTVKISRPTHFRLVKPVYSNMPMLPPTEGHMHYILNGMSNFVATRDATTALSHRWCGKKQGVKMGKDVVRVYLATSEHKPIPGAMQHQKTVMVK